MEIKKKEDALKALDLHFKSQAATFMKDLEASKRSSEQQQDKKIRSKK